MTRKLSSTKEGSVESTFEAKPYTGKTAFEQWVEYEGIPMIRNFIVPDLSLLALKSWDRVGAAGSWLVLGAPEDQLSMAAYICEIGAGKSTKPQRHLFEELIFVLSGSGGTTVWNDGAKSASFEWKRGSTFSPPINAWHQHFNRSGTEPVRYVAGVPHIHTGVYAKRIGLQQKQSAIASAMRALRDGAVYMKANKAGSIQVIQKISKLNDKQVAERSYDILKEDVVTDPRIPAEVIHQSIKLAARSDGRVKNVDISKAVDLGVANRIMESGK